MKIRIATRKSALALWQAKFVARLLENEPGVSGTELVPLSTRGDEILDKSLQKIGGKGLFIKELEVAMQNGDADIAVHSMKDVPAELPAGFHIAATLARANYRDALVCNKWRSIEELPQAATVGSSSLRRQAQLKMLRPDVDVVPLRGNVNTRLRKLDDGQFDAIILAAAGLERLGFEDRISQAFSACEMLPAAAQGVLGIECLETETALYAILSQLNDTTTRQSTMAERAVARALNASCQSPVAAFAEIRENGLSLTAMVAHPDGRSFVRDRLVGPAGEAESIGEALAENLLSRGAREILDAVEAQNA